jgi:hypothetical protein
MVRAGQPAVLVHPAPASMMPGRAALAFQIAPEAERTETQ